MARCLGTSRKSGIRCKSPAMTGRKFCRLHGGKRPLPGLTHPNYKYGLYSSALPNNLAETAARSASDPNILMLNEAIGALDSRLVQLMKGLSDDEAGRRAWSEMRQLVEALEEYIDQENTTMKNRTFRQMYNLLESQFRESSIWEEIYSGFEIRRRLVETETKRREKAANIMHADQAMVFMHQVVVAIRRHVIDFRTLEAIANDLTMIAHRQGIDASPLDGIDHPDDLAYVLEQTG